MKRFPMKDLGQLHYVLGINCETNDKIGLTQEVFINKLIDKYGLSEANEVSMPHDSNVVLMRTDGISKPVDKLFYQSLIGSLLYIALWTRPDIQFAVSAVGRYSSESNQSHLTDVKSSIFEENKRICFMVWTS